MADKKKDPWSQWYWADWKACPEVRACSLTARGLWLEMLALMSEADPYGHMLINGRAVTDKQLANQAGGGVSVKEIGELLAELEAAGVFSRTPEGVIFSRRMVRDKAKREEDRANGKRGGNPRLKPTGNRGVNPSDKASTNAPTNPQVKAHIPEARDQEVRTPMAKNSEGSGEHVTPAPEKPPLAIVAPIKPTSPVSDFDPVRDMPSELRRAAL